MEKKTTPGKSDRHWTLASRDDRVVGGMASSDARWNYVDRRNLEEDRRAVYDRRELIRFADERRAGQERRVGNDL